MGLGTEVALLDFQVAPISQMVLETGFSVTITGVTLHLMLHMYISMLSLDCPLDGDAVSSTSG